MSDTFMDLATGIVHVVGRYGTLQCCHISLEMGRDVYVDAPPTCIACIGYTEHDPTCVVNC